MGSGGQLDPRSEQGMTLVEVLIASLLLVTGLLATFGTFAVTGHVNVTTQRTQVAFTAAEQQLETLRAMTYTNLALSSVPTHTTDGNLGGDTSGNPTNPDYWVSSTVAGNLIIPTDFNKESSSTLTGVSASGEVMVSGGSVSPGPTTVTVNGYTVKVSTFITYVNDSCVYNLIDLCATGQDAKRIVVAAIVSSSGGGQGAQKPVWLTTVVGNPKA